jgi:hypothetical protein
MSGEFMLPKHSLWPCVAAISCDPSSFLARHPPGTKTNLYKVV